LQLQGRGNQLTILHLRITHVVNIHYR